MGGKKKSPRGRGNGSAGNNTSKAKRNVASSTRSVKSAYGSSSVKRRRRTRAEIAAIRDSITDALLEDAPMTVRQLFYRLVSDGAIKKAENEYKGVVRLVTEMRLVGDIDFDDIADNTRWMRKPDTYSGLERCLRSTARSYRRALWDDQDVYVEIWCEKDALAGVLNDVTEVYDVPLMVTHGYASLTFLHGAAEAIDEMAKPAFVYFFGDYDPSGIDIARTTERRLREFAPDAEIHFERVAVAPRHITELGLPTRPTKSTDSRSWKFRGESVELDAIRPATLREMVRACIERHIDARRLAQTRKIEAGEREVLQSMAERLESNGNGTQ